MSMRLRQQPAIAAWFSFEHEWDHDEEVPYIDLVVLLIFKNYLTEKRTELGYGLVIHIRHVDEIDYAEYGLLPEK